MPWSAEGAMFGSPMFIVTVFGVTPWFTVFPEVSVVILSVIPHPLQVADVLSVGEHLLH